MHKAPSTAPLALPTTLLLAALLATAHGKSLVIPPPDNNNVGPKESCGNPEVSQPPFCLTCRDSTCI
jgi:hypothetical protein